MALERLSLKELQDKSFEIFYDFMSSDKEKFFDEHQYVECTKEYPTPMHMLYKEMEDTIAENTARIKLFEEAIEENKEDSAVVETLKENLQPLLDEKEYFNNTCMKAQKELYAKTGLTDYSRNLVRIPLDKKINSYYDDLILEVAFYDDIAVPKGQYETYKTLETQEARRNFIKENTEITHLGLVVLNKSRNQDVATIQVLGDLNKDDDRVKQSQLILLDSKFADFNTLTLADTMEISQNNDLRQLLQSKIDLDKENMELLADLDIRGSNYKLFKNSTTNKEGSYFSSRQKDMFIRYVCPSTGRVYYNPINTEFLAYSEYFKEGDYNSYLEAWWNVCHVGANPREGMMARC